jgi:spectrin beta
MAFQFLHHLVSGRRGSTSSDKKRSKSRARSKSPFRSFRWPKKTRPEPQQPGSYSDDEDNVISARSTLQRDGDELEGMLVRKHEWESTTKKASNRSWDKVCVVLKGTTLGFFKDQKSYRSSPEGTYRGEVPVELLGGTAEIASDYTKKKHVFRLKLNNGGDYLFQASEEEEMTQWVNSINSVAESGASASGSGRAQTLPVGQGERRPGDEPKKRSFFTLKKK